MKVPEIVSRPNPSYKNGSLELDLFFWELHKLYRVPKIAEHRIVFTPQNTTRPPEFYTNNAETVITCLKGSIEITAFSLFNGDKRNFILEGPGVESLIVPPSYAYSYATKNKDAVVSLGYSESMYAIDRRILNSLVEHGHQGD